MSETKKFRTLPGRGAVRIALTNGHETYVTEELEPLAPQFHKAALVEGCISEEMLSELKNMSAANELTDKKPRLTIIAEVMANMLDSGEESLFDESGKPYVTMLSDQCGFKVTAKERDAVFERLSQT